MTRPRTAILLAAGRARRLGPLCEDRPKCLLEVGGKTIIEHQIAMLRAAGIRRFVVVTGYYADKVEQRCGPDVAYVLNEVYERTNSLYSLHLALAETEGGFVLTNADVLFHPAHLDRLLDAPQPDVLLYEPARSLGDEEMKVRLSGDRVTAMAKDLPDGTYDGENLGLLKFSAAGAARLRTETDRLVAANEVNTWAPKAFDAMCSDHPIHAVAIADLPWIEIDFPEDLERARRQTWPRIEADIATRTERGEAELG